MIILTEKVLANMIDRLLDKNDEVMYNVNLLVDLLNKYREAGLTGTELYENLFQEYTNQFRKMCEQMGKIQILFEIQKGDFSLKDLDV